MDPKVPKAPAKPVKPRRMRAAGETVPAMPTVAVAAPAPVIPAPSGLSPAVMPVVADAPATPPTVAAPAPVPSEPTGTKPAPAADPAPVVPAPATPATPDASAATDPAAPLAEASAPTTPPAVKEVIMETIENVTAKAQTAFSDATAQAKGAVEKSQKLFEDANEFGKGNIEALVEASKVAARGMEAIGQDAAAFAKKSFEDATAVAKTLTTVKSPTEMMKLQSDYVRSAFDAMIQQTSRNTEAMLKLAGEIAQPLSNRVALAAEKMKVAA